jgi:L-ascorbate metabolism protein UlaG (beta-lactamase superfamily)
VVLGHSKRLYLGGDSGYFMGFKQIGEALGPFDLAAVPIGAYKPSYMMKGVHTSPEEAVQAFEDLRGKVLLGIHWGTFNLAEEPPGEPPERMREEARRRNIDPGRLWILERGETRHLQDGSGLEHRLPGSVYNRAIRQPVGAL